MMSLGQIRARAAIAACALTILCSSESQGQPDTLWTNSDINAGSDLQVIRTSDGGYAVGTHGWSGDEERGDADFQLMKLDSLGDLEWRQFYPGIYNNRHGADYGYMVSETPDGGYVMGGARHGSVLIRTDDVGDTLWMRYYSSDDGFRSPYPSMKCLFTPDRNIVFNSSNMIVEVNDEDGAVIWREEYDAMISGLLHADNGGYFITGFTNSFGAGSNDIYAAEIEADGELIWQEAYGFEMSDVSSNSILMSDGGICIIGSSRYGNGRYDKHPYIVQIDREGNLIWERIYENIRGISVEDLVETSDGGFAVAGHGLSYSLYRFGYIGEMLWSTYFDRYGERRISGEAYSILLMEDGGYLLGGFANIGLWLVRTEPDPVDIPFELELEVEAHDFEEVAVDSVREWEFEMRNIGRRYVVIDTLWFEGDTSVFACSLDLPFRIEPEDTSFVPVWFQPLADSNYTATLILPFGDEQTLEITLSGRGFLQSAPEEPNILREFVLQGVFPNPFNSVTAIRFALPEPAFTKLTVFDITGRQVASVIDDRLEAGRYTVEFDAGGLSSGIYLVRLEAEDNTAFIKMALVK